MGNPLLSFFLLATGIAAAADNNLQIPAITVPLTIEGQRVAITTGGSISKLPGAEDQFRIDLKVDLSDLQRNLTAILQPQIDRADACGERVQLHEALLTPSEPSGSLTVKLHYERWACAKALGKKIEKRLVGGNGMVPVKLTPALEAAGDGGPATVRLSAEVGTIEADGSLGDLLRSGSFGDGLREKITRSMQSAIDKSANWNASIPPALQSIVKLRKVEFQDGGSGRLMLHAEGEVRIPADQLDAIIRK
jgi:hypothetical protein